MTRFLAVSAGALLALLPSWEAGPLAAGCAPTSCQMFVEDRLEVELSQAVPAAEAADPRLLHRRLPALAAWLRQQGRNVRLEPSAGRHSTAAGLNRFYTLRFRGNLSKTALLTQAKLLTTVRGVVRVAPVPGARPPTWDPLVGSGDVPTKSTCGSQWYLFRCGITKAWDCGATGEEVVVAVVDWGFVLDHPELDGVFEQDHAYNVCQKNRVLEPNAESDHGTGSAGLIAARKDGEGIQGIAYGAKVWPIQAPCASGANQGCDLDWKDGNPWAEAIAHVIAEASPDRRTVLLLEAETCCGGNYEGSLAVNAAIRAAVAQNIVVVVAAGNKGSRDAGCGELGEEIEDTGAIVVGATLYEGNARHPWSAYGSRVDVSAPGESEKDLTLALPDSVSRCDDRTSPKRAYTSQFGGTSGASAKVAGVVALMLHKKPDLTPEKVRKILRMGPPVAGDKPAGAFLDAEAAIKLLDGRRCEGSP